MDIARMYLSMYHGGAELVVSESTEPMVRAQADLRVVAGLDN